MDGGGRQSDGNWRIGRIQSLPQLRGLHNLTGRDGAADQTPQLYVFDRSDRQPTQQVPKTGTHTQIPATHTGVEMRANHDNFEEFVKKRQGTKNNNNAIPIAI